ncbi:MAG: hypothetical protein JNL67_09775 [Planctomycetaceae bacterium]|nr:hypothetical protein [Planctomycetaceae bacterium]
MSLFSIFKSRTTRELESKIRFRRGKGRVQKYVQEAQGSSEKYWKLACEAYRLGDPEQFQMIAAHFLRLQATIGRWQRFLVKLEALELSRNEVATTREFLQSIGELTTAIHHTASPQEITRMQADVERAIEKSKSQEELLDTAMEATSFGFENDFSANEASFHEMEKAIANSVKISNQSTNAKPTLGKPDQQLEHDVLRAMNNLRSQATGK